MGVVYVSNLEACTLTGKTARAKCGQTALMSQLGQWVVLIHELRQLGRTEEFFNCSHNRTNINQYLWCNNLGILNGHTFADYTLHTGKTDTELVL